MGCNTSKESVQPATEDDDKDDGRNGEVPEKQTLSGGDESTGSPASVVENRGENEEEAAATRIQATFRGHRARRSMKETEGTQQQRKREEAEPSQEQLQEEFREDDKDLCNAATKIQASFRGHMSRKEQAGASKAIGDAAANIEEKMDDALNELDGIDLTDPDLHKAATKIQASFRGHKVRQEVTPEEKK